MKRSVGITGCVMAILFGATLAQADWASDRSTPRRHRQELADKAHKERERKEHVMTPEEKLRRQEASARRRATFNNWVVNPIKRLKPRRRPGPPSQEAVTERKERMQGKFSGILPRRYPSGQSTDPATGGESQTNVQPAIYTTEETK